MLKIKDNTTEQKLPVQNCGLWNNGKIKHILWQLNCIRNGVIYINDITVNVYNESENFLYPKSNASFVKRIKKLNKENYFDDMVEKID